MIAFHWTHSWNLPLLDYRSAYQPQSHNKSSIVRRSWRIFDRIVKFLTAKQHFQCREPLPILSDTIPTGNTPCGVGDIHTWWYQTGALIHQTALEIWKSSMNHTIQATKSQIGVAKLQSMRLMLERNSCLGIYSSKETVVYIDEHSRVSNHPPRTSLQFTQCIHTQTWSQDHGISEEFIAR